MTHQVALPPEQEQKLTQQARLRGLGTEDYLRLIVVSWLDGALPKIPAETEERYGDERAAEFLLTNAVDAADYAAARQEVQAMGLDPDQIAHRKPVV